MANTPSHRRSFSPRAAFGLAEHLEARRLLAAALDPELGILTITGDVQDNIIQIQVADSIGGAAATTFSVLESVATDPPPPLSFPTQQQILDYIASGGAPNATVFNIADVRELRINSGDGDDLIILGHTLAVPATIDSGGGNDSVSGGTRDDTITGGSGNDYLFGHDGNDVIGGALGGDEVLGGDDDDTADFKTRTANLQVSTNNLIGDGEAGENDNIRTDIEGIIGGSGNDTIDASAALTAVVLDGADGNDILTGGDFDDSLIGAAGADEISGGDGDDFLSTEDGVADDLDGGSGLDVAFSDDIDNDVDVELDVDDDPDVDPPLQAGGTAVLNNGVLTINGGASDDAVGLQISQNGLNLLVVEIPDYPNADLDNDLLVSQFTLASVNSVVVNLGGGSDLFHGTDFAGPVTTNGGTGSDIMAGGNGDDALNGDDGDDYLLGRGGDDVLDGGNGGDFMSGGTGDDTGDYSGRGDDVLVGIGQLPDDGNRGEGDNVQEDIETVMGGDGNDRINTQGVTGVTFIGGPGRDILTGGPGADSYFADDNEIDTIRGGGGGDSFNGDQNDDVDLNG